MKISARIFLGYFLIIGIGVVYLLNTFTSELRPTVRQSAEDSLVEVANLLAVMVEEPFQRQQLNTSDFSTSVNKFINSRLDAQIWNLKKTQPSLRIYITDSQGIVVYDSSGIDVGADYSQWNDVYLTLRGRYGARSTQADPGDEQSSIMHVAAPIKNAEQIIGVLTVAKPNAAMQPFIDSSQRKMMRTGLILFAISLFIGLFFAVWFTDAIRKLVVYAKKASQGQRTTLPSVKAKELAELGQAVETMRQALEGKDYVENYIHTLTHEMKSPLSAIQGAAELMREEMSTKQRQRFLNNVLNETQRLQDFINRMLDLAAVEKRQSLQNVENIKLNNLLNAITESKNADLQKQGLRLSLMVAEQVSLDGERFLLQQAISNLIDNAIRFSPAGGEITVNVQPVGENIKISIEDTGSGIPDYAQERIFERFYSLPDIKSGDRSSGIGLSFVKEVAELHKGKVIVKNAEKKGVIACITLPLLRAKVKHT